jgi:hypothetical protein
MILKNTTIAKLMAIVRSQKFFIVPGFLSANVELDHAIKYMQGTDFTHEEDDEDTEYLKVVFKMRIDSTGISRTSVK